MLYCSFIELKYKDVVNIKDGVRLGRPGDIQFDCETNCIKSLVVLGRRKCFGLMGREEDLVIPWDEICTIGEDTILVSLSQPPKVPPSKGGFWEKLFD